MSHFVNLLFENIIHMGCLVSIRVKRARWDFIMGGTGTTILRRCPFLVKCANLLCTLSTHCGHWTSFTIKCLCCKQWAELIYFTIRLSVSHPNLYTAQQPREEKARKKKSIKNPLKKLKESLFELCRLLFLWQMKRGHQCWGSEYGSLSK